MKQVYIKLEDYITDEYTIRHAICNKKHMSDMKLLISKTKGLKHTKLHGIGINDAWSYQKDVNMHINKDFI